MRCRSSSGWAKSLRVRTLERNASVATPAPVAAGRLTLRSSALADPLLRRDLNMGGARIFKQRSNTLFYNFF